jgi:Type II CAAX prenyl endopeptidase Rce1-like
MHDSMHTAAQLMLTHIPIPEGDSYGVALALVYGLGALPLAALCHARLLVGRLGFPATYLCVLMLVNVWGFVVVDDVTLLPHGRAAALVAIMAGAAAGWLARQSDRKIVRYTLQRSTSLRSAAAAGQKMVELQSRHSEHTGPRTTTVLAGQVRNRRKLAPQRLAEGWEGWRLAIGEAPPGLFGLTAGGALEELSYRGFIVQICLQAPSVPLRAAALVVTTAAFALSHVWFGWAHVAGKAALGIIALGLVMTFQSVIPAIVAHIIFNASTWRDLSGQGYGHRLQM